MSKKTLITNIKSKQNVKNVLYKINPDKIAIISSKKVKFTDFDIEMENIRVKEDLEKIIHGFNKLLNTENDVTVVFKPDKMGMYLFWLAQMKLINPTYIMANGQLEQIPMIKLEELGAKKGEILKLANCHGFIDPKSINKEFGTSEEEAKGQLEDFLKMGIIKFVEKKEFEIGDMKEHPYYDVNLLEKGKEIEDFYAMTELGRMLVYLALTGK